MLVYLEDLKKATCGCGGAGCQHGNSGLYLNQRCHFSHGAIATVQDSVLRVQCAVCRHPIVNVAVSIDDVTFASPCHPEGVVTVFYKGGELTIKCKTCEKAIRSFPVRSIKSH